MTPVVLFYHQILRVPRPDHYFFSQALTLDEFRTAMLYLKEKYHIISLDELHLGWLSRRSWPRHTVAITFDDGFKNNLWAARILHELHIPATFFVLSNVVDTDYRPWYLEFAHILSSRTRSEGTAPWGRFQTGNRLEFRRWRAAAKEWLLSVDSQERSAALAALAESLGAPPIDANDTDYHFLTSDDLREIRELGMTIGGHSASHDNLTRCSPAELERELVVSADELGERIGQRIEYTSYPDGRYNENVLELARHRFKMAFSASCFESSHEAWRFPRRPGDGCPDVARIVSPWYPWHRRLIEAAKWILGERA